MIFRFPIVDLVFLLTRIYEIIIFNVFFMILKINCFFAIPWLNFYFSIMIAIQSWWMTLNRKSNSYIKSCNIPRNISARHLAVRLLAAYFYKQSIFTLKLLILLDLTMPLNFLEWLLLKKEFDVKIKIEAGFEITFQKMTLEIGQKLRFITSNFNTNFKFFL